MNFTQKVIKYGFNKETFEQDKKKLISKTNLLNSELINNKPLTYLRFVKELNNLNNKLTSEEELTTPLMKLIELKKDYLQELDKKAYDPKIVLQELTEPYNEFFNKKLMNKVLPEETPLGIKEIIDNEQINQSVNHYLQNFKELRTFKPKKNALGEIEEPLTPTQELSNSLMNKFKKYLNNLSQKFDINKKEITLAEQHEIPELIIKERITTYLKQETISNYDIISLEEMIIKHQLNKLVPIKDKTKKPSQELTELKEKVKELAEQANYTQRTLNKIRMIESDNASLNYKLLAESEGINERQIDYTYINCLLINELGSYLNELTSEEKIIEETITRSPQRTAKIIEAAFKPLIKGMLNLDVGNTPLMLKKDVYSSINDGIKKFKKQVNQTWARLDSSERTNNFEWPDNLTSNQYDLMNQELLEQLRVFIKTIKNRGIPETPTHLWLEYSLNNGLLKKAGLNNFLIEKLIETTGEDYNPNKLLEQKELIEQVNKQYMGKKLSDIEIGEKKLSDILKSDEKAEYMKLIKQEVKEGLHNKEKIIDLLLKSKQDKLTIIKESVTNEISNKLTKPGDETRTDYWNTIRNNGLEDKLLSKQELLTNLKNDLDKIKNKLDENKNDYSKAVVKAKNVSPDFKKLLDGNFYFTIGNLMKDYDNVTKALSSEEGFNKAKKEIKDKLDKILEQYQIRQLLTQGLDKQKLIQSNNPQIKSLTETTDYEQLKNERLEELLTETKLDFTRNLGPIKSSLIKNSFKELIPKDIGVIMYGLRVLNNYRISEKVKETEVLDKAAFAGNHIDKLLKKEENLIRLDEYITELTNHLPDIKKSKKDEKKQKEIFKNITAKLLALKHYKLDKKLTEALINIKDTKESLGNSKLLSQTSKYINSEKQKVRKEIYEEINTTTRLKIPDSVENTLYYNVIDGLGRVFNKYKQYFNTLIDDSIAKPKVKEAIKKIEQEIFITKEEREELIINAFYDFLNEELNKNEYLNDLTNNKELTNYFKNLIKNVRTNREQSINNTARIEELLNKNAEKIKQGSILEKAIKNIDKTDEEIKKISEEQGFNYQEFNKAKKKITNIRDSINKGELTISQGVNDITKQYNLINGFGTEQIKNLGMNELNQKSIDLMNPLKIVLEKSYGVLNSLKNIEGLYEEQENKINNVKEKNEKELRDYLTKLEQEFINLREQIITNLSEEEIKTRTIKLSNLQEAELKNIIEQGTNLEEKIKTINTRQIKSLTTIFNKEILNKNEKENINQSLNELENFYKNYQESKIKKVIYKLLKENTDKKIDKTNVEGFLKNIGYKRLINTTRKGLFKKVTDTETINEDKKTTYLKQENLVNDLHKKIVNNKTNSYKKKIEELTNYVKDIEQKLNLETYNLKELELEDNLKQEVTKEVLNESKKQLIKILNNFRISFNKTITGDNLLEDIITENNLLKPNKQINNLILSKFDKNLEEWYKTIKKYQTIEQETNIEEIIDESINKSVIKRDFKNTLKKLKTQKKLETITNFVKKHPQYDNFNISKLIGQTENQLEKINEINSLSKNEKQELTKVNIDELNNEFSENITKIDEIMKTMDNWIISLNELEQSNQTTLTAPPSNLKKPPETKEEELTEEEIANKLRKNLKIALNS